MPNFRSIGLFDYDSLIDEVNQRFENLRKHTGQSNPQRKKKKKKKKKTINSSEGIHFYPQRIQKIQNFENKKMLAILINIDYHTDLWTRYIVLTVRYAYRLFGYVCCVLKWLGLC